MFMHSHMDGKVAGRGGGNNKR